MKLGTWNVNGIRARQQQVQDWIERERPDVVCLQEIKASSDQIPLFLCDIEGYWCYWHGGKGYSGVALHVSRDAAPERPNFFHPEFDYENRIVAVELGDLTVASGRTSLPRCASSKRLPPIPLVSRAPAAPSCCAAI
jgi:exodeoxyribonuclease-3